MSDFESAGTNAPRFSSRPADHTLSDLLAGRRDSALAPTVVEREGLPPGYRMRADPHYVEQLVSRPAGSPVQLIAVREIDAPAPLDSTNIEALAKSIGRHGVVQPLLVRRHHGRYRLIGGRRRLAAAIASGLTEVPCIVHNVDDAEAEALAQADNLRVSPAGAEPAGISATRFADLLEELSGHVTAMTASTALLGGGNALHRRVGIDLVKAEAWRAAWLLQAAALVAGTHQQARRTRSVASVLGVLDRVIDGFAPERRLSGVRMLGDAGGGHALPIDEQAIIIGLTGAVMATLTWLEGVEGAVVRLSASAPTPSSVVLEVAQDMATVPPAVARQFFDPAWSDRRGGLSALVGALAIKAAAERHGGSAECVPGDAKGSAIRLTLRRAS